jgi:hypothetical protein
MSDKLNYIKLPSSFIMYEDRGWEQVEAKCEMCNTYDLRGIWKCECQALNVTKNEVCWKCQRQRPSCISRD